MKWVMVLAAQHGVWTWSGRAGGRSGEMDEWMDG